MCFCWLKRKPRLKPAKFFAALQQTRTQFLQRFSGQTPIERYAAEDDRQAQVQTNEYIKSGGEHTAHRR